MTFHPDDHPPRADRLAQDLDLLGFYATANDVRRGLDVAEVIHRLRRDAPKRREDNCRATLALANELDTR